MTYRYGNTVLVMYNVIIAPTEKFVFSTRISYVLNIYEYTEEIYRIKERERSGKRVVRSLKRRVYIMVLSRGPRLRV